MKRDREAIKNYLRTDRTASDRKIARKTSTYHQKVAAVRKELGR